MAENQSKYIGAGWKKSISTQRGQVEILRLKIGDKFYTAWPNGFKKGEVSPDYNIQEDNYRPGAGTAQAQQKPAEATAPPSSGSGQEPADDLPF